MVWTVCGPMASVSQLVWTVFGAVSLLEFRSGLCGLGLFWLVCLSLSGGSQLRLGVGAQQLQGQGLALAWGRSQWTE